MNIRATNSTPTIAVIGSFVIGVTVTLPRFPYPGETLEADAFDLGAGGKGNNLALAARRLGASVVLVERLGSDMFADMAYSLYRDEGIDATYVVRTENEQTGIGLVYLNAEGENQIGLYKGANRFLSPSDIRAAEPALKDAALMTIQLEVPDPAIEAALDVAERHGLRVILNPAPARPLSHGILSRATVLTPNVCELFQLTGRAVPARPDRETVAAAAGSLLVEYGIEAVVVTMGKDGALLVRRDLPVFHQPPFPVKAVDTVGAGDSFNAGLAVALAQGLSYEGSVRRAAASGALATTRLGVAGALPYRNEVEALLEQGGVQHEA